MRESPCYLGGMVAHPSDSSCQQPLAVTQVVLEAPGLHEHRATGGIAGTGGIEGRNPVRPEVTETIAQLAPRGQKPFALEKRERNGPHDPLCGDALLVHVRDRELVLAS